MISPMQDEVQKMVATELGIADMPVDAQQQILSEFGGVALKAATIALLEKLPEGKHDEFVKLADAGDQAAVNAFLAREVSDYEEVARQAVAQEVKRFKEYQQNL